MNIISVSRYSELCRDVWMPIERPRRNARKTKSETRDIGDEIEDYEHSRETGTLYIHIELFGGVRARTML